VDYDKFIEISPKNASAYLNRGAGYGTLGNTKQAIEDLKTAARLGHEASQRLLIRQGINW
jgi:regulator of sirC expression with transglutaminase-like and TPR domain